MTITVTAPANLPDEVMIECVKPTRIKGVRMNLGDCAVVGSDITEVDARILLNYGCAVIVADTADDDDA